MLHHIYQTPMSFENVSLPNRIYTKELSLKKIKDIVYNQESRTSAIDNNTLVFIPSKVLCKNFYKVQYVESTSFNPLSTLNLKTILKGVKS